jgi:hypothetical protein
MESSRVVVDGDPIVERCVVSWCARRCITTRKYTFSTGDAWAQRIDLAGFDGHPHIDRFAEVPASALNGSRLTALLTALLERA